MIEKPIIKRKFKVQKKDISYIRFILEGYEGMAIATTIDKNESIVEINIMPDYSNDIDKLFDALREEIEYQEIL